MCQAWVQLISTSRMWYKCYFLHFVDGKLRPPNLGNLSKVTVCKWQRRDSNSGNLAPGSMLSISMPHHYSKAKLYKGQVTWLVMEEFGLQSGSLWLWKPSSREGQTNRDGMVRNRKWEKPAWRSELTEDGVEFRDTWAEFWVCRIWGVHCPHSLLCFIFVKCGLMYQPDKIFMKIKLR